MPWFPEFAGAVELARRQARAAGLVDPVGQYFTALNQRDARALATAPREDTPMQATYGSAAKLAGRG